MQKCLVCPFFTSPLPEEEGKRDFQAALINILEFFSLYCFIWLWQLRGEWLPLPVGPPSAVQKGVYSLLTTCNVWTLHFSHGTPPLGRLPHRVLACWRVVVLPAGWHFWCQNVVSITLEDVKAEVRTSTLLLLSISSYEQPRCPISSNTRRRECLGHTPSRSSAFEAINKGLPEMRCSLLPSCLPLSFISSHIYVLVWKQFREPQRRMTIPGHPH
jgi:hypothetical protein